MSMRGGNIDPAAVANGPNTEAKSAFFVDSSGSFVVGVAAKPGNSVEGNAMGVGEALNLGSSGGGKPFLAALK